LKSERFRLALFWKGGANEKEKKMNFNLLVEKGGVKAALKFAHDMQKGP